MSWSSTIKERALMLRHRTRNCAVMSLRQVCYSPAFLMMRRASTSSSPNWRSSWARSTLPDCRTVAASATRAASTGKQCRHQLRQFSLAYILTFSGSMDTRSVCTASTPTHHSPSTTRPHSTPCTTSTISPSTSRTPRNQTTVSSSTSSQTVL